MTKRITTCVVIATIAILAIYDTVILLEPTQGDTISEIVRQWASDYGSVPFGVGVLVGHWFWPRAGVLRSIPALLVVCALMLGADLLTTLRFMPVVNLILGAVAGGVFWGPEKPCDARLSGPL